MAKQACLRSRVFRQVGQVAPAACLCDSTNQRVGGGGGVQHLAPMPDQGLKLEKATQHHAHPFSLAARPHTAESRCQMIDGLAATSRAEDALFLILCIMGTSSQDHTYLGQPCGPTTAAQYIHTGRDGCAAALR